MLAQKALLHDFYDDLLAAAFVRSVLQNQFVRIAAPHHSSWKEYHIFFAAPGRDSYRPLGPIEILELMRNDPALAPFEQSTCFNSYLNGSKNGRAMTTACRPSTV